MIVSLEPKRRRNVGLIPTTPLQVLSRHSNLLNNKIVRREPLSDENLK